MRTFTVSWKLTSKKLAIIEKPKPAISNDNSVRVIFLTPKVLIRREIAGACSQASIILFSNFSNVAFSVVFR